MPRIELPERVHPLHLQKAEGWRAAMVAMPSSAEQRDALLGSLEAWVGALAREHGLIREVFLQVWKLGAKGAGGLYGENVQRWLPARGLGIWPGRRPPQRMTQEIAMDCAAAMLANEEQPLASHPVAHVSAGPQAGEHALRTLFGTELTVQMLFGPEERTRWPEKSRESFVPVISEAAFQRERFYLPLFDAALLEGATGEQLSSWTCGASLYLRESAEDKAVLVLSRYEL